MTAITERRRPELIADDAKYKKAVRIGSVATTVLYEGLYIMREAQRRAPAGRKAWPSAEANTPGP